MARFGTKIAQGVFAVAVAAALGIGAQQAFATPAASPTVGTCDHDTCDVSCQMDGYLFGHCENWECICY